MAEQPDYKGLVQYLMKPFLDSPEALRTDIEALGGNHKIWLRVAFAPEDRGRMFGRGGRNIQAIRTILETTGALYNQRVSLDVYGESSHQSRSGSEESSSGERNRRPRRHDRPASNRDRDS